MKICFVQSPAVNERETFPSYADFDQYLAETSSTGIILLAAILERYGMASSLVDLSSLQFEARRLRPSPDLALLAAEYVAKMDYDVVGVSTICSTYPVVLRFVAELKRLRPGTPVILGGPQATVVDEATMAAFPAVDLIVRGEADETLPLVLNALAGRGALDFIPGVTFRAGGRVIRNPNAAAVADLDSLPLPAYDLLPGVTKARQLHLEVGRGCPFACTFCSTNDFFRRRFRLKSPAVLIAQTAELQSRYNVKCFDLTLDLFTVDRRRVIEFCDAFVAAGTPFTWLCSGRTDCVDVELLHHMARAGCTGIFYGIESGSQRMQAVIQKGLDLPRARTMIRTGAEAGIETTIGLILGFPEEEEADISATLDMMVEAWSYPHVLTQVSVLAPLAGTPIYHKHRDQLEFDGLSSDLCQLGNHGAANEELIARHRDVFPDFYTVPTRMNKQILLEMSLFFTWAFFRFRWIVVGCSRVSGGALPLFRRWIAARSISGPIHTYYPSRTFQLDALRFFDDFRHLDPAVMTLVSIEEQLRSLQSSASSAPKASRWNGEFRVSHRLFLSPGAALLTVPGDPKAAIQSLASGTPMTYRDREPLRVCARTTSEEMQVQRLDGILGAVLPLCDGAHSSMEIAKKLAAGQSSPLPGEDPVLAWLALIKFIVSQEWIQCTPARKVRAAASGRPQTSSTSTLEMPPPH